LEELARFFFLAEGALDRHWMWDCIPHTAVGGLKIRGEASCLVEMEMKTVYFGLKWGGWEMG